jgi:hypothetical protein
MMPELMEKQSQEICVAVSPYTIAIYQFDRNRIGNDSEGKDDRKHIR